MATPVETAKVVKFALSALAGENGHHSFEDLCRQVAKLRIAGNVLPATGPVSAGGDQGRDFETFRTYLVDELPFASGFLALATRDVVVFACTLQKDKLKAKFEADIKAICTQGTPVDRIYVFAAADVPVRLRHDLQAFVQETYEIGLEIIDGAALAEWLGEPSLYWIAEQYLHLPAELAPPPDEPGLELPGWYTDLRAYWQAPHRTPSNLGDLFDLRHGLRHAVPPGPARADLDGWLRLMTQLAEQTADTEVRLHAVYEIAVARSRGKGDLRPAEPLVRRFAAEIHLTEDPSLLFDASVLIQFCSAAAVAGHTDIPLSETLDWLPHLRRHVNGLLDREWGPNTRAGLLQAAANAALLVDLAGTPGAEPPPGTTLAEMDRVYEEVAEAIESGTLHGHLGEAPLVDLDDGMRRLAELTELLPEAPGYPIEAFATIIDLQAVNLCDHPRYQRVCDSLDEAIKAQEGEAAVGERCRQRAVTLQRAGRLLDALREYHRVKVEWFHGDTLPGAIRAVAHIVDIYRSLGMYLAAKKYALALAAIARGSLDPSDREVIPKALFSAAENDWLAGAWVAAADLASIAGMAHYAHAPDPENFERHAYVPDGVRDLAISLLVARQVRPDFEPALLEILDRGPWGAMARAMTETAAEAVSRTEAEWLDWLPDLVGVPFSDVGPERVLIFRALGVSWSVHCANDQATVLAMEDFASSLQIVLVEMASLDPVLIPQEVDIEVRTYPAGARPNHTHMTRADGDRRRWLLLMPGEPQAEAGPADPRDSVVNLVFRVLLSSTLLDREQFGRLMDQAAGNGLFGNLEIGRPYPELARFRTQPVPPLADAPHRPLTGNARPQTGSSLLEPRTDAGPGYTEEKARAVLAERYELLPVPIRHTLPDLLRSEPVRTLFQELRAQGWKDWHLLSVVTNLTINHRVEEAHGPITAGRAQELMSAFHAEARREEQPDDSRIPPEEVDRGAFERWIRVVATSSLGRWNLTLHHGDVPGDAVLRVLEQRYGFREDDIAHADPFDGLLS